MYVCTSVKAGEQIGTLCNAVAPCLCGLAGSRKWKLMQLCESCGLARTYSFTRSVLKQLAFGV